MSIYTLRSGATSHPEDSVMQFFTDFVNSSGVLFVSDDHFKVVENSPIPDMTVKVKQGRAYVTKSAIATNVYPVRSDAEESVIISSNSSGNPRIDAVVLYIDKSVIPNFDASNVAKIVAVEGSPAAAPQPPTDDEISTVIGVNNPFLRLAEVFVASGATEITNSDITDKRVRAILRSSLARYKQNTDESTITFNMEEAEVHSVTLGGNRILVFANVSVGQVFTIRLKQDGTGSRTVTWPSGINWADGVAPTLTTTANKTDVFSFICTGSGAYDGFVVGQNL